MSEKSTHELLKIAEETRRDFFAGAITMPHLIDVALINRPDLSEAERKDFDRAIALSLEDFPFEACQVATDELLHRIGYGRIADGSYVVSGQGEVDGYWRHEWLDLGATEVAEHTILDITADQFDGPPIYLGSFQRPWATLEDLQKARA